MFKSVRVIFSLNATSEKSDRFNDLNFLLKRSSLTNGHFWFEPNNFGACCFHMANGGSTVLHEVFELSEQLFHISSN